MPGFGYHETNAKRLVIEPGCVVRGTALGLGDQEILDAMRHLKITPTVGVVDPGNGPLYGLDCLAFLKRHGRA